MYGKGKKMTRITSAYANKLIKKLNEDKDYWRAKEQEGYLYIAALDEEAVIPDYDYAEVASKIEEIDDKIVTIKHAINVTNATNKLQVGDKELTVDMILIRMSQLNKRKLVLDQMRKQQPKVRINSSLYSAKKTTPEYQYINYDLDLIKSEYERIDQEISQMQLALDRYNQVFEFDVDI